MEWGGSNLLNVSKIFWKDISNGKISHSNIFETSNLHITKYIQKIFQKSYIFLEHKILLLTCAKVSSELKVIVNF